MFSLSKVMYGPMQFGFKKNSSCNSALFTFTEATEYCNNLGSKVYCAFLDANKAFDKVFIIYFHAVVCLWSPYVIGRPYIFSCCGLLLLLFFFFFPRLISAAADWMSAILPTWCGLSANLRCRSETCCRRLTENTGRKKGAKNRHLGTIAQLCQAISSQLRHISTIEKKLVKQQYVLHNVLTIW